MKLWRRFSRIIHGNEFLQFILGAFVFLFAATASVAQAPTGLYTFGTESKQVVANGTTTANLSDGFFAIVAQDGSGASPSSDLYVDADGAFITDYSSNSGSSWIELRALNGGTFSISDAVIGDSGNGPGDFSNVYVEGRMADGSVVQTATHSSIGNQESDYNLDFSLFAGVNLVALRVHYSWGGDTHGQIGFVFKSVTIASSSLGDTTAPTVSDTHLAISGASGTNGAYRIGDTVTATWNNTASGDNNSDVASVTFDFSQFGGGSAVSAMNLSGTWTASHTITAGSIDTSSRNVSITVTDTSNNQRTVSDTTNATLDNIAPTVTDGNIAISGATGTGGAFKAGDTVTATWTNTAGGDNNADTISSVTVDFSQFGGGAAVSATNSAGTWTATYTIVAGAIDATNRNASVTATDNAGNTTTTADTSNATVDNQRPTVTGVSSATADGT